MNSVASLYLKIFCKCVIIYKYYRVSNKLDMSLQRTRPINTLQKVMSSFKHFEKKIDKLQEDVNYHGHTLSEIRVMVANLSAGTIMTHDTNIDSLKRTVHNTAIQYEDRYHLEEPVKIKRKNAVQPYSSKIIAKSFQSQKIGLKPAKESQYRIKKMPSNSKVSGKYLVRHKKGDVLRKSTTISAKKTLENKLIKVVNKA